MKTEKVIIIKKRGGTGGRRRGPLPSVPRNPNVDRRRIGPGFTPTFVFGGDVTRSINPSVPRPPGSPPVKGIGFPDQNDNAEIWTSPIGRSKELILIMSLDYDITATYPTPLVPDSSWTLIPGASVDIPFALATARFALYWRRWKPGDPVYFDIAGSELRQRDIHLWAFEGIPSADEPFYAVTTSIAQDTTVFTPTLTAKNIDDIRLDFLNPTDGVQSWSYVSGTSVKNDLDFYLFTTAAERSLQIASTPVVSIAAPAGDKEVGGVEVVDSFPYPDRTPNWQLISLMLKAPKNALKYPLLGNPFYYQFSVYDPPVAYPYVRQGDVQFVFGKAPTKPVVTDWTFTKILALSGEDYYLGLSRAKEDRLPLPGAINAQMSDRDGNNVFLTHCGKNLSTKFEIVGLQTGTGLTAQGTSGQAKENEMVVEYLLTEVGDPLQPGGAKTWSNTSLDGFEGDGAVCRGYGNSTGVFNATQFELYQSVPWAVATLKFKKR